MIHQNQFLFIGIQNMKTGNISCQSSFIVNDRIASESCLQHFSSRVLGIFTLSEGNDLFRHDQTHFRRQKEITAGIHRAVTGSDDGTFKFPGCRQYRLTDLICPYNNQHSRSFADQCLLRCRIITDNDNTVINRIILNS